MRLIASLVALNLGFVLPAAADTLPPRKPGLWESKSDAGEGVVTVKQCIDAATDTLAKGAVAEGMGKSCSENSVTKTPTGYATRAACTIGTISSKVVGVVSGDFESSIRMEMTTTLSGIPGQAQPTTSKSVIESRWAGPCAAGQKPGDIILGDGKVIRTPGAPR